MRSRHQDVLGFRHRTPSLALAGLNALGLLALCVYLARTSVGGLAVFLFVVLWAGSTVWHAVLVWVDRRVQIRAALRTLFYLLPAALLLLGVVTASNTPQPVNRRSPATSPDGNLILSVPIEKNLWRVTIRDQKGNVIYRDAPGFGGLFNVYWIWDRQNRVWLFDSDTSYVYYWENTPRGWRKVQWGYGHTREVPEVIEPPEALYPEYARQRSAPRTRS